MAPYSHEFGCSKGNRMCFLKQLSLILVHKIRENWWLFWEPGILYINRKEMLCILRIWMLASLNRSCLATICSPPQWPCFYPTEKRNFSCLIGVCIYQVSWECVILARLNLVWKRYRNSLQVLFTKKCWHHQIILLTSAKLPKNIAVKCALL